MLKNLPQITEKKKRRERKIIRLPNSCWSAVEINFLISNYGKLSGKEFAAQLNRSEDSISSKLHHLRTINQITKRARCRIGRVDFPNSWSAEEVNFLIRNYRKLSGKEFAAQLNRSEQAVASKLYLLRQAKQITRIWKSQRERFKPSKRWSAEEIDFLIRNYGILSAKEFSAQLNRSEKAILAELHLLRLSNKISRKQKPRKKKNRIVIYHITLPSNKPT